MRVLLLSLKTFTIIYFETFAHTGRVIQSNEITLIHSAKTQAHAQKNSCRSMDGSKSTSGNSRKPLIYAALNAQARGVTKNCLRQASTSSRVEKSCSSPWGQGGQGRSTHSDQTGRAFAGAQRRYVQMADAAAHDSHERDGRVVKTLRENDSPASDSRGKYRPLRSTASRVYAGLCTPPRGVGRRIPFPPAFKAGWPAGLTWSVTRSESNDARPSSPKRQRCSRWARLKLR